MAVRDIIVIGASAGGTEALVHLVRGLPASFPASLFVVCHVPSGGRSFLPEILSRSGPLLATHAATGEFFPGHVFVAPPGHHLVLEPGAQMRLTHGPRENSHRPAIDPLFRSAARHYGVRVISVVLTGSLSDGTAGTLAVRAAGGVAVAQDPRDAVVAAMPQSASQIAGVDHVVPLADMPRLLIDLVRGPMQAQPGAGTMSAQSNDPSERSSRMVEQTMRSQAHGERRGQVSMFTCPECGGALWQMDEPALIQFRCHVGHAYTAEVLLTEQTDALEAALWTAVRTFREKTVLTQQLATRERERGNEQGAERFEEQASQTARYANLIVEHVLHAGGTGGVSPPDIDDRGAP
ncbi:chemotaxis protein : Chemotaxis protein CheB OS=Tolypothrix bouteillei VB521301 GN=DA73_11040 PE=4 SV=1: CheB_methylest [Gemmata massiliana]|uniref:protein-glutamate methylesterase n=1 Tax=Gemmata massiliana TaxID=1210884 RepID=A0A6P2CYI2_9BACT|nr:chemotaxis protein CheB [Gemmata massiliana]VTR92854.1 chemotaxis protein : Chemotaxis protein CheB OS=Tolypothrix bouteillei VB521301 GN=DA73_11040 PE=4 SV=1: CheB_methylest [Gemmata massiliana]